AVAAHGANRPRVRTGPVMRPSVTTTTVPGTTTSTAAPLDDRVRVVSRTQVFAPGEMIATSDGVWLITPNLATEAPTLLHVSPSGGILSTTALPGVAQAPVYLASGEGSIWAAAWANGTVFRIDPTTGAITAQARLGSQGLSGEV